MNEFGTGVAAAHIKKRRNSGCRAVFIKQFVTEFMPAVVLTDDVGIRRPDGSALATDA
jgi:hypothetical protein